MNGWIEDWTAGELTHASMRRTASEFVSGDAEPEGRCRMSWVTDRWGETVGYNTARSAFWRVIRRLVVANPASHDDPDHWSSRLVSTNLYKVSAAAGWNPGGDLQRAQRLLAIELLRLEIAKFEPRRVLALTGTWINPFVSGLGLSIEARDVLVEGVGSARSAAWAIAKHPMGKPGDLFVSDVMQAFADLGRPLG